VDLSFHHELQAAELMCCALLAFSDVELEFSRGLLGVCLDEIRHMNLFREHISLSLGLPEQHYFEDRANLDALLSCSRHPHFSCRPRHKKRRPKMPRQNSSCLVSRYSKTARHCGAHKGHAAVDIAHSVRKCALALEFGAALTGWFLLPIIDSDFAAYCHQRERPERHFLLEDPLI